MLFTSASAHADNQHLTLYRLLYTVSSTDNTVKVSIDPVDDGREYTGFGYISTEATQLGRGTCLIAADGTALIMKGSQRVPISSYSGGSQAKCNPNEKYQVSEPSQYPASPQFAGLIGARDALSNFAIDREGYLWTSLYSFSDLDIISNDGKVVRMPWSEYDFTSVGLSFDSSTGISGVRFASGCYLLGKSRTSTTSYTAQMPTTGAPEGLTAVGVFSMGLAIAGVGIGLARHKS